MVRALTKGGGGGSSQGSPGGRLQPPACAAAAAVFLGPASSEGRGWPTRPFSKAFARRCASATPTRAPVSGMTILAEGSTAAVVGGGIEAPPPSADTQPATHKHRT